jgi:hypothetical protein
VRQLQAGWLAVEEQVRLEGLVVILIRRPDTLEIQVHRLLVAMAAAVVVGDGSAAAAADGIMTRRPMAVVAAAAATMRCQIHY